MNITTATCPGRQRKPRQKPQRFIRLCIQPEGTAPGIVQIRVGKDTADYFLTAIPADFGKGFLVEKIGLHAEGKYAVNINGEKHSCECKGHARHGHCKHADGLAALIGRGQL